MAQEMSSNLQIITIVGDSLSISGDIKHFSYKDTYAFKLQSLLNPARYHVVLRSRIRNTVVTESFKENLYNDILYSDSKYVILHLGIVDCAPRLFSMTGEKILHVCTMSPVLKSPAGLLIKFKSRYRRFFTKYFPKTYVSKEKFEGTYKFILQQIRAVTKPKRVFIINIADTNEKNKTRFFGFEKNIREYNGILSNLVLENADLCTLIDFFSLTKKYGNLLVKDGVHLTKRGHELLSRLLYNEFTVNNL